jgi:hypothetical protein
VEEGFSDKSRWSRSFAGAKAKKSSTIRKTFAAAGWIYGPSFLDFLFEIAV